ncbi:MAG: hypothetical protein EAX96_00685 [Candidatus Lokiarchaeota archaeon]|nr:hypothetical protein [Candidatus Lokiarchaeota archaeon]
MNVGESGIINIAEVNNILKALIKDGYTIIGFEIKKSRFDLTPIAVDDPLKLLDPIPLSQYFAYDFARADSSPKFLNSKLRGKKVALFARPCDTRALIELSKLKQVILDDLFIITLECPGRASSKDVVNQIKKENLDPENASGETLADKFTIQIDGKEKILKVKRLDNCGRCVKRAPSISDLSIDLVGDKIRVIVNSEKGKKIMDGIKSETDNLKDARKKYFDGLVQEAEKQREKEINDYLKLSDNERFEKAMKTIEKCRLCGQCINACPVCYCQAHGRCEIQAKRKAKELDDPVLYWLTKMTHMSDICIGCGRCTPVCPVNIPNAFFYDVMNKYVEEEFQYVSGKSKDDLMPRSMKAIKAQKAKS